MKPTIKYKLKETPVQVIHDNGEIIVRNGVLVGGERLCAIYDLDEEWFPFVCTIIEDLGHILATECVSMWDRDW